MRGTAKASFRAVYLSVSAHIDDIWTLTSSKAVPPSIRIFPYFYGNRTPYRGKIEKIRKTRVLKKAWQVLRQTGRYGLVRVKPRKIRGKLPLDTDDVRVNLEAMQGMSGKSSANGEKLCTLQWTQS